jgi:hypothetical protein
MRDLECGHYFSTECYTSYLEDSVISRGLEAIFTTCPSIVGEDLFKSLLSKQLYEKYCHYVVRSYVE